MEVKVLAFFPWAQLDEPIEVGQLRLIPFERGALPGDQPHITQAHIDGVLSAYTTLPGVLVNKGMLVEYGDWRLGQDMPADISKRLFQIRGLVALSALALREPFTRWSYPNYSGYDLVIQRYREEHIGTFAFDTRRRDTGTTHMWDATMFTFGRPMWVDANFPVKLDVPLLDALLNVGEEHRYLFEAIEEFNCANTDSPTMPEHVELVMCKTAFEWLLKIDYKGKSLIKKMAALAAAHPQRARRKPLAAAAVEPWPMLVQWGAGRSMLASWADDFNKLRNQSAHGAGENPPTVWNERRHLLFVSCLFPLLVRLELVSLGLYAMTRVDQMQLSLFDHYLGRDPYEPIDQNDEDAEAAWHEIDMLLNIERFHFKRRNDLGDV